MYRRVGLYLSLALLLMGLAFSPSSSAGVTRIEQDDLAVTYQGAWQTLSLGSASDGTLAASNQPGDVVSVTFTGTAIAWIGYRCPCGNRARVFLDGEAVLTDYVDTYAPTHQPQAEVFRIGGLTNSRHTLLIRVTDLPNQDSSGAYIGIDAFEIESETWQLEESAAELSYTGTWIEVLDSSASGGSILASQQANAVATVRFNGTGIEWYGARCPCGGEARVFLDGVFAATVNTYASSRVWGTRLYAVDGLTEGEHTLDIVATGLANSTSTGAYVVVDRFVVALPEGDSGVVDTEPPEVEVTTGSGMTVYGDYAELRATAQDNVGVESVRFYVDDVQVGNEDFDGPVYFTSWSPADFSDGSYAIYAVARDAAGNETRSGPVAVHVDNAGDHQAPTARITAPEPGSAVTGVVTISADASDNVGVTRVRFYADTIVLGDDTTAPYSITRDTSGVPSGNVYYVQAVAFDAAGNESPYGGGVVVTVQH